MEYIYFVFLVVLVLFGFFVMLNDGPAGVVLVIISMLLITAPYASHNSDMAKIDYADRIIKVETDYSEKLKNQLASLPSVSSSLVNGDTPYASIVAEIALSEKRVRDANADILEAEMSIEKRKRFATSFVLWFF